MSLPLGRPAGPEVLSLSLRDSVGVASFRRSAILEVGDRRHGLSCRELVRNDHYVEHMLVSRDGEGDGRTDALADEQAL